MIESTQVFESDVRKENPGLHLLYVKWAVGHLTLIDNIIQRLFDTGNLNLLDMRIAVINEREKLVKTNAAYADAQEILHEQTKGKLELEYNDEETN